MWTAEKDSLCSSHDTIKFWANETKKKLKKYEKNNSSITIKDVIPYLDNIIKESRIAKKKGQVMENRLLKYRRSIEALGFKRVGR